MKSLLKPAAILTAPLLTFAAAMAQPVENGTLAEKMAPLSWMAGEWRGTVTVHKRDRSVNELVHTERAGHMLSRDVMVVEGRAYEPDGSESFNAFGIISYNPYAEAYEIRAYTGGNAGTYPLRLTETGYEWSVPAGPGATVDYVATYDGETWSETGTYVNGEMRFETVSFTVEKIGSTEWPAAGKVPME